MVPWVSSEDMDYAEDTIAAAGGSRVIRKPISFKNAQKQTDFAAICRRLGVVVHWRALCEHCDEVVEAGKILPAHNMSRALSKSSFLSANGEGCDLTTKKDPLGVLKKHEASDLHTLVMQLQSSEPVPVALGPREGGQR